MGSQNSHIAGAWDNSPRMSSLIKESILSIDNGNGVTQSQLYEFIKNNYDLNYDPEELETKINETLEKGGTNGWVREVKENYYSLDGMSIFCKLCGSKIRRRKKKKKKSKKGFTCGSKKRRSRSRLKRRKKKRKGKKRKGRSKSKKRDFCSGGKRKRKASKKNKKDEFKCEKKKKKRPPKKCPESETNYVQKKVSNEKETEPEDKVAVATKIVTNNI